jgi:hypothetical protein
MLAQLLWPILIYAVYYLAVSFWLRDTVTAVS